MDKNQTFYLSSMESVRFAPVRRCRLVRRLRFETGKDCAIIEVSPPVVGQDFNQGSDIHQLLVACRHEGATLFPISEFPLFVSVGLVSKDVAPSAEVIAKDDVAVIAWGELYPTAEAAALTRIDPAAQ